MKSKRAERIMAMIQARQRVRDLDLQAAGAWTPEEADNLGRQAERLFKHDRHGRLVLERENCSGCVLQGYQSSEEAREAKRDKTGSMVLVDRDGPNYAGWERAYVQTGRRIQLRWAPAFVAALDDPENPAYAAALLKDINTFGVAFTGMLMPYHGKRLGVARACLICFKTIYTSDHVCEPMTPEEQAEWENSARHAYDPVE